MAVAQFVKNIAAFGVPKVSVACSIQFHNQACLEPDDSTGCPYGAGPISIFEKNSEIIRPFRVHP